MAVARYIRSSQEFQAAVTMGSPETKFLDFKETLADWQVAKGELDRDRRRQAAQKELCRDVAQFANTEGGCLLIGVAEHLDQPSRLKVADKVVGVSDPEAMRQWIDQAVGNYLSPRTLSRTVDPIVLSQGTILAVNIEPSRYMVSVWDQGEHAVEYLYRTSHGKAWMNPSEAEAHIMSGSRFGRIAIEQAIEKYEAAIRQQLGPNAQVPLVVDLISGVFHLARDGRFRHPQNKVVLLKPTEQDSDTFGLSVNVGAQKAVWIPYGAVRDAWLGKNDQGATAIGLLLSVRLAVHSTSNGVLVVMEDFE